MSDNIALTAKLTSMAGGIALVSGDAMLSLFLALLSVALARTVFVDRQNRKMGRRQTWRETLPLTLVAMLIAGVIVVDGAYGLSKAVFIGLGVGWTAVLLLDIVGQKTVDIFGGSKKGYLIEMNGDAVDGDIPPDMLDTLKRIDIQEAKHGKD